MGRGFWGTVGDLTGVNYVGGKLEDAYDWTKGKANDAYDWGKGVVGDAGDALNAPYAEKRKGLEGIQARLDALKQERLARMDALYGRANSQYDDTRKAMSAAYGDPSTWKL